MPTKDEYLKVVLAFKLYGAETEGQLVLALLKHVEKLQEKIQNKEIIPDIETLRKRQADLVGETYIPETKE